VGEKNPTLSIDMYKGGNYVERKPRGPYPDSGQRGGNFGGREKKKSGVKNSLIGKIQHQGKGNWAGGRRLDEGGYDWDSAPRKKAKAKRKKNRGILSDVSKGPEGKLAWRGDH